MRPSSGLGTRIAVVGPAVSGKSTLARTLGEVLGLPVVEIDALYWEADWGVAEPGEFLSRVNAATTADSWIVDGHYERIWPSIWPRAETVIWLDLPLRILLVRGFRRSWRRWRTKELLWNTNREHLCRQLQVWDPDRSLLGWLLRSYSARRRSYVQATLDDRWSRVRFIRLCSPAEIEQFLSVVSSSRFPSSTPAADG